MTHFKYTSTKEFVDAFPVAYRQWKADSHCNLIHGYSFTIKLFFGGNDLDVRNWIIDYGSLRPLKEQLEDWFDHRLLVSGSDPHYETIMNLHKLGIAKVTEVENTGCEAISDFIYKYINGIFMAATYGKEVSEKVWCYKVEVRETQSNMAFREGYREDNEDLFS